MKAARLVAALFILVSASALAASSEPPPGAASCSGCHAASRAVSTPVPRIYGRPANDIVTLVAAFRSATRPATVMNHISKGFTDEEMRAIAAWLELQK